MILYSGGVSPTLVPEALAADQSAPAAGLPRLIHLQILRALAASFVVADHTLLTLQLQGKISAQAASPSGFFGTSGVVAFFILSGLIMVRQSFGSFGRASAPLLFALHRIVRIVPMYWIATLLWLFSLVYWHHTPAHALRQTVLSLLFVPNYFDVHTHPVLPQGWTLNHEMQFYTMFTLALFLRRRIGLLLLIVVPTAMMVAGLRLLQPTGGTPRDILLFYLHPQIILFAAGVLVGILEVKYVRLPKFSMPVSPAFLLVILPSLCSRFPTQMGRRTLAAWLGLQVAALLVVVCCASVRTTRIGWVNRLLVLLGDASYSTYLFHLWITGWVIGPVAAFYARLGIAPATRTGYLIAAVVAANLLGLAVHLAVERPMTRALRRLIPGRGLQRPRPLQVA